MNEIMEIKQELHHAGENVAELIMAEDLERMRITPEKEIPKMEFLYVMFGRPCFPRGELVALSGKAKSGKTFVCSILMSLAFKREVLTMRRACEERLSVLWYDTEQSEESTQDILNNRIMPMIGSKEFPEEQFHIFNVRSRFWNERMPLLECAMHRYCPDIVILDGIRDLVNDINDGVLAQEVIEHLMRLASEQNCCIVCILHQNKGSEDNNLRGWIGTELKNKAFEVFECSKNENHVFTLHQTDTRKYDIVDKLSYVVGNDGIPRMCAVEMVGNDNTLNTAMMSRPLLNEKYVESRNGKVIQMDVKRLFCDAFEDGRALSASELQERVMKLANITSAFFYNKRREEALSSGVIVSSHDADNHTIYLCPSKAKMPPQELSFLEQPGDAPF